MTLKQQIPNLFKEDRFEKADKGSRIQTSKNMSLKTPGATHCLDSV